MSYLLWVSLLKMSLFLMKWLIGAVVVLFLAKLRPVRAVCWAWYAYGFVWKVLSFTLM